MNAPNTDDKEPKPEQPAGPTLEPCPPTAALAGRWAAIIVGTAAAGLVWAALRAGADDATRQTADAFLSVVFSAGVLYVAFRALYRYPFRLLELMVLVWILAGGGALTIEAAKYLAHAGFQSAVDGVLDLIWKVLCLLLFGFLPGGAVHVRIEAETVSWLRQIQYCFFTVSVLLGGGALGLHFCWVLKLEGTWERLTTVIAGALVLPAAAGTITFPVFLFGVLLMPPSLPTRAEHINHAPGYIFLWALSFILTCLNARRLIQALALRRSVGR